MKCFVHDGANPPECLQDAIFEATFWEEEVPVCQFHAKGHRVRLGYWEPRDGIVYLSCMGCGLPMPVHSCHLEETFDYDKDGPICGECERKEA